MNDFRDLALFAWVMAVGQCSPGPDMVLLTRTALAEVQRRSDEMLQASRDLLEQGRTDAARRMLTDAVATSGDDVQSAALRAHLERHDPHGSAHHRAAGRTPRLVGTGPIN